MDPAGKSEAADSGNTCYWQNSDRGLVHITWIDANGIRGGYDANDRGEVAHFAPVPDIEGYPAAAVNFQDRRSEGECSLQVGTADSTSLMIRVRQSASKRGTTGPCDVTALVAKEIVTTIKAN